MTRDHLTRDAGDDGVRPSENVGAGDRHPSLEAWRSCALGDERSLEEQWKQEIGPVSHLLRWGEQNIRSI
jgi:hypothetical protein